MKKKYFIHESSYIEDNCIIGENTKVWHFCHIMGDVKIGKSCLFGQNVFIGQNVIIGNNVKVQNNVSIYSKVVLQDNVFCGPSMVFTNDMNPRSAFKKQSSDEWLSTLVKEGASIGANATILCGITIGKSAFIGAGAVVTKSVPDYALYYGNPAKVKGWICDCGIKLNFEHNLAICEKCNSHYKLNDKKVVKIK